jgi:RND family efflux transporter MFP subunit
MTESLWISVVVNCLGMLRRPLAAALLSAGVLTAACGGGAPSNGAPPGAAAGGAPGGAPQGVPVEVVTLAPRPVEQVGEFVGTIKSRRSTNIQPQAEGFLTRILVKSGDRVSAGTPMFEIDATSQQAAVAGLESMRAAREADATYARQQAERAASLLKVGAMSQQEADQAIAQQKAADAQLKAAEQQIKQQQNELAYYRVTAPTAGIVGDVPVRQGDRVTKSTLLTTIDDNAALEVYINVPVEQASRLRLGLPVRILNDAGDTVATERINFIAPSVDDQTQTVLVKTPLLPSDGHFRTEQFVRAHVVFSNEPALTVPVVSVTRINAQYFVFVAEAGPNGATVAHQRPITVGPVVDNEYVVTGGLKAGDRLVASGIQKIGDGVPITAVPPPAAQADPVPAGRPE